MKPKFSLIPIILICFIAFGSEPDSSAVTPACPESGNASGTSQQWIPDQVRDDGSEFTSLQVCKFASEMKFSATKSPNSPIPQYPNYLITQYPNSPIPQNPNNPITQFPNHPISQYPNNLYYYPWLEFPSRRVSIHPDSLPPNQGTDELTILFNAIGPYENSMLGKYLCLAGDQNGDGFDDIIAYCDDPPEVRLYFGGDTMDTIPDFIFPFEPGVFWAGVMPNELEDLNGDEDIDIVIHWGPDQYYEEVHVFFGGNLLDNEPDLIMVSDGNSISGDDGFGRYMSCGDLNGDSHKDLVIGAPNYLCSNFMTGKVFCYFGGVSLDSIPDFTMTSGYNDFGMGLGAYVSCGGDVNNDGFDDLLCFWNKASLIDSTGVHLFFGNTILDSIPDWTYQLLYAPNQYNVINCCIINDLNNDNYDEIAVVTMYSYGWEIHLFFGGEILGAEPDLIIPGGTEFLRKIKTTGDVNADGYNDMIIGSPDDNWVKIYYGGNPMDIWADITFYLPDAGYGAGFAGDVNNDGIHDFMFYANDDAGLDAGQIFIYGDPDLTPHVEPRYRNDYPLSFALHQNFPNPFNGATVIGFQSFRSGWVDLKIYNILGQMVYSLSHDCSPGEMVKILWDGRDMQGNMLSSGVYLVELTNGVERRVNKLQIIR